jgi:cyanobactin maturation PatA/PatG family protease
MSQAPTITATHVVPSRGVVPSGDCNCSSPQTNIFAIGNIGYDFGTEARRDSFRQQMPLPEFGSPPVETTANPYDVHQLHDYLERNPWESTKLTWTLNLDLIPIYALEAELAYADYVYEVFREALLGETLPNDDLGYVSRVSIPGVLTNQTTRLFSGQVVPVVKVQRRGLYSWNEAVLVEAVVQAVEHSLARQSPPLSAPTDAATVRGTVRAFLDKVYYQFRNLGQSSPDRALNFAVTNAMQFGQVIGEGILSGFQKVPTATIAAASGAPLSLYSLDTIDVQKSPYCRMDSDCWDVKVTFFDPENDRRARAVYQFTIDVSDEMPVSLAPVHQFLIAA